MVDPPTGTGLKDADFTPLPDDQWGKFDAITEKHRKKVTNGHSEEMPNDFYDVAQEAEDYNEPTLKRIPPHDIPAEKALLSSILIHEDALPKIREELTPSKFYSEAHRTIYEVAVSIDGPVDIITVASALRAKERLAQVGGFAYLTELLNVAPKVANVRAYAHTVIDLAKQRDLLHAAQLTVTEVYARSRGTKEIASTLRATIEIVERSQEAQINSTDKIFEPLPDIPFLAPSIGIAPGAPVLVGGYGSSGKTTALQSMMVSIASGQMLWGQWAIRKGRGLHIDYEQGHHLTHSKYQRLTFGMQIHRDELEDRLETMIMPPFYFSSPSDESVLARLGENRDVVLIDSFRACAPTIDENSSEVRIVLDAAGHAAEKTGCVFIFIVHARKPSENQTGGKKMSFRGSSAFFDGSGSAFIFTGEKNKPSLVDHERCRIRGRTEDPFHIRIEDIPGPRGLYQGLRVSHESAPPMPTREGKEAEREEKRIATKQRREEERTQEKTKLDDERKRTLSLDVDALVQIVAPRQGIGRNELRAPMSIVRGGCGTQRVLEALAAAEAQGLIRVEPEARGKRAVYLGDGRRSSTNPPPAQTAPLAPGESAEGGIGGGSDSGDDFSESGI